MKRLISLIMTIPVMLFAEEGVLIEVIDESGSIEADEAPRYVEDEFGIVVDTSIVFPTPPSLPGPESETNRVAVALLEMAQMAAVDNFDQVDTNGVPYTTEPIIPTWTWAGFLGEDETNGVTRVAKKACFDWYLNFMATNSVPLTHAQTNLAGVVIGECTDLRYTNAWCSLIGMTRNPVVPFRDLAGVCAVSLCPESEALVSFGLDAFTNAVPLSVDERSRIISAFSDKIARQSDQDSAAAVNCMVRRRNSECEAAMALDRLFVARVPGYEYSSNRLETAQTILANPGSWDFQNEYFNTVTNMLMNADRPLLAIDGL